MSRYLIAGRSMLRCCRIARFSLLCWEEKEGQTPTGCMPSFITGEWWGGPVTFLRSKFCKVDSMAVLWVSTLTNAVGRFWGGQLLAFSGQLATQETNTWDALVPALPFLALRLPDYEQCGDRLVQREQVDVTSFLLSANDLRSCWSTAGRPPFSLPSTLDSCY
jgi:hypothetical protein